MVCKSTQDKIPYFNAPIFLENKQKIGKVEEILGPITEVFFTVKLDTGVNASSFNADDKFYIAPDKLLPASRFTNPPPAPSGGRGGGRGGARGGRGGGGRGGFAPRGGARGGFAPRGASRGGARGSFSGGSRGGRGAPRGRGGY